MHRAALLPMRQGAIIALHAGHREGAGVVKRQIALGASGQNYGRSRLLNCMAWWALIKAQPGLCLHKSIHSGANSPYARLQTKGGVWRAIKRSVAESDRHRQMQERVLSPEEAALAARVEDYLAD